MNCVEFPQTFCFAGVARADITPPVGIYHRMWGAAKHERATGVHRPLTATLLLLAPCGSDNEPIREQSLVIASLDHCLLDDADIALMQRSVAEAGGVQPVQVQIAMTHTHAAGLMSRSRGSLAGGELIGPYLDGVAETLARLTKQATNDLQEAEIVYGHGRCSLAADRDYWDEERKQFVCGFNPLGAADDTLVVARIWGVESKLLATMVNYACHPTTLAWDNTAISPDYLGAMRETMETVTKVPCLFLQGASADLGPRDGFVGDWQVADMNGRQLGYAALSTLEPLPLGGGSFHYLGPVVSGATIGTWEVLGWDVRRFAATMQFAVRRATVELPYRVDLPDLKETERQLAEFQSQEAASRQAGDEAAVRDWRAKAEQMNRQLWKLHALPAGKCFPLTFTLARLGDAIWLFLPGEHYQFLQTTLRRRFPDHPWIVTTISNGWQPGYLPPASKYGYGIYQEQVAVVGPGAAELVVEAIAREVRHLTETT